MATTNATNEPAPAQTGRRRVRPRDRRIPAAACGTLAAVLLATLVGCSGAAQPSGSTAGAGVSADQRAAPGADPAAAKPPGQAAGGAAQAQDLADLTLPRALVRTAELTVRVDDVGEQATRVGQIARATGGEVYADSRSGSGDQAKADIVVKVDPDRLDGALGQIASLGTETQRSSSTEDVTEQVADVDSRLATMKGSIARVRVLLARARTVGELVSVEGELSRREADLEALQAKQRALNGQVALATVTVHLLAKQAPEPAAAPQRRGFPGGLAGGWRAFLTGAAGCSRRSAPSSRSPYSRCWPSSPGGWR